MNEYNEIEKASNTMEELIKLILCNKEVDGIEIYNRTYKKNSLKYYLNIKNLLVNDNIYNKLFRC